MPEGAIADCSCGTFEESVKQLKQGRNEVHLDYKW